jgi:hypothetical protein
VPAIQNRNRQEIEHREVNAEQSKEADQLKNSPAPPNGSSLGKFLQDR